MSVEVVPIESVAPAAYNPREVADDRLDLIRLSLAKLGFLLPLYASPAGELLSGHQRQTAARQLGATRVPVARCRAMDLGTRKVANLIFNRATNDMTESDTPSKLAVEAKRAEVLALAASMPDIDPESPDFMPVLRARPVSVRETLDRNRDRAWPRQAATVTGTLRRVAGVVMPVVMDERGHVVNGLGRLRWMAAERVATAEAVVVSDQQARFADAMLNLVSMEFDLQQRYADLLRHNSFRRNAVTRRSLGQGFVFAVHRGTSKTFDLGRDAHRRRWLAAHGRSVVDFGAGHGTETRMLRAIGVHVDAFEPYPNGGANEIDVEQSRRTSRAFLQAVATGRPYTSLFCSSVLNSVPFRQDREHIVTILAALAGERGRVFLCARGTHSPGWFQVNGTSYLSARFARSLTFRLDYEPGITVGGIDRAPKVQKFHTVAELRALAGVGFSRVTAGRRGNNAVAVATAPRPLAPDRLAAALRHEFDLPYPDGTRMGLAAEALAAFSTRLRKTIA